MIVSITPDIPFSLDAAAAFGFGPNTGRPKPDQGVMRLAFAADDLRHYAVVELGQDGDGPVTASIDSDAPSDTVTGQVRRILSLDQRAAADGRRPAGAAVRPAGPTVTEGLESPRTVRAERSESSERTGVTARADRQPAPVTGYRPGFRYRSRKAMAPSIARTWT